MQVDAEWYTSHPIRLRDLEYELWPWCFCGTAGCCDQPQETAKLSVTRFSSCHVSSNSLTRSLPLGADSSTAVPCPDYIRLPFFEWPLSIELVGWGWAPSNREGSERGRWFVEKVESIHPWKLRTCILEGTGRWLSFKSHRPKSHRPPMSLVKLKLQMWTLDHFFISHTWSHHKKTCGFVGPRSQVRGGLWV